jgi:hypothetical protein
MFKSSVLSAPTAMFFSSNTDQLFLGVPSTPFSYLFSHQNHMPVFPILFPRLFRQQKDA